MHAWTIKLTTRSRQRVTLAVLARSWADAARIAIEAVGSLPVGLTCRRR